MPTNNAWNSQNPAQVAKGGTGLATATAYAPICAGTTATGAFQAADTGLATANFVLTSNGAASLPSFQAVPAGSGITSVVRQVFTYTGGAQTYTPTNGMKYCDVEVVGGGGGGSSIASYGGAGGGAGGYAREVYSAATIGASQSVTIGAGGGAQSSGGTTSLGAGPLMSATGGVGVNAYTGGGGGSGSGGNFNCTGGGGSSIHFRETYGGSGGSSVLGGGGSGGYAGGGGAGGAYGGGGGGKSDTGSGGGGANGVCIVTEYI